MEAAAPEEVPEEYEFFIQGEVVRDENIMMENTMKRVLYCIGFLVSSSQLALVEDSFGSFNGVIMLPKTQS